MTVFDQTTNSILPKFKYEALYDGKYYRPTVSDKQREAQIRSSREKEIDKDLKTDFIDPIDYPNPDKATPNNLPYSRLVAREHIIHDSDGYRP